MQPTKFDELWSTYSYVTDEHQKDRQTYLLFLPQFIKKLITHLNWSPGFVEFETSKEKFLNYQEDILSLNECLIPLSNKGCWQFRMRFTLAERSQSLPPVAPHPVTLVVPFVFTSSSRGFYVTVATTETKSFRIEDVNSEEFVELGDFVFQTMYRKIQDELMWQLEVNKELEQVVL